MDPSGAPTPSGTTSQFSNMLNQKLDRLRKKGQPTSLDELREMRKKKGISKAQYKY